ncbi:hypothetical protein SDC9_212659 [bioreactor metagenome]|uniref:Uncharacterized protein n=1 Tax=bioreactor metagenome TaxID=1076179 RepID=A0A645JMM8_9ZZZZ
MHDAAGRKTRRRHALEPVATRERRPGVLPGVGVLQIEAVGHAMILTADAT